MVDGAKPVGRRRRSVSAGEIKAIELARAKTAKCIVLLMKIGEDDGGPIAGRVAALNAILDRGWGKPAQMIADPVATEPEDITDITLEQIIAARAAIVDEC